MFKVFYITHQMTGAVHGGAEVQLFETMKAVNRIQDKYRVSLFNHWENQIKDADLIHFFNPRGFLDDCRALIMFAKKNGIPVVTSPIFYTDLNWRRKRFVQLISEKFQMAFQEAKIKRAASQFNASKGLYDIISKSDLLLPNTELERDLLVKFYGPMAKKSCVVPNGVNSSFKDGDPSLFTESFGVKDFVLYAGRIELRKNTLRLIEAFKESNLDAHLVIVGEEYFAYADYAKKCRQAANDKVIFVGPLDHDSEMLKSAYKAAKVLALPSYFETPGISALEGGLAGANILITKYGGTKEYFGDMAWYVEPDSAASITRGLKESFNATKSEALSHHIERNFLWEHVAGKTIEAYDRVLSLHSS